MLRLSLCPFVVIAGFLGSSSTLTAQHYYPHTTTHIDLVPHTTTHLDAVRHGNHYHYVPHTTTHFDAVPHTTTHYDAFPHPSHRSSYSSGYRSYYPQPYSAYRSNYLNPRAYPSTHLDIVRHGRHYHVVPHTTWGRH